MVAIADRARQWAATPGLVAFMTAPQMRARPHLMYRGLRLVDPMHESPIGLWILTTHDAVTAALRHPLLGSDEAKADLSAIHLGPLAKLGPKPATSHQPNGVPGSVEGRGKGPFSAMFPKLMLFRDPPDHTRIRSLVNKAFTPRVIESLEGRIGEIADEQLDRCAGRTSMELLADFAYPFPARVICELLGAPAEDHELIARHAPAVATRLDPDFMRSQAVHDAADRATVALTSYLEGLIADRRRQPGTDLLSQLIAAEDTGDRLSHDELVANVLLLLIAGHETTANLLGNGVLALLRRPDELVRLRRDPSLDKSAVDELMRFDGPIQMAERITLDDVELCGRRIPRGRIVVLCTAAANRDPAVFTRPQRLDIGRSPNPHVGFGGGAHFCIGAPLARLEARVALRRIIDRFPDLALAGPRPRWRRSFTIRGLTALHLVTGMGTNL